MTIVRVCVLVYVLFALWLIAKFETVLLALLISDVLDDPKPQAVMRMNPTKLICERQFKSQPIPTKTASILETLLLFTPSNPQYLTKFSSSHSIYVVMHVRWERWGGASSSAVINLNRLHPNSVSISEVSQADQVG
jgi:hypothetical protein